MERQRKNSPPGVHKCKTIAQVGGEKQKREEIGGESFILCVYKRVCIHIFSSVVFLSGWDGCMLQSIRSVALLSRWYSVAEMRWGQVR